MSGDVACFFRVVQCSKNSFSDWKGVLNCGSFNAFNLLFSPVSIFCWISVFVNSRFAEGLSMLSQRTNLGSSEEKNLSIKGVMREGGLCSFWGWGGGGCE